MSVILPDRSHLHRVIYRSAMVSTSGAEPFTDEIQSILEKARAHNPTVGVTGALVAGEGHFAQVLEGPFHALRPLYGNIACDPRHRHVLLLDNTPIGRRDFSEWSMAYVPTGHPSLVGLTPQSEGSDLAIPSLSAQGLLEFLRYALRDEAGLNRP